MNDNSQCQTSVAEEIAKLTAARNRGVTLGDADTLRLPINNTTCRFFRVNCLTYEKDFPRQEAFENVVASINNVSCRLIYYLRGINGGVEFYIGVMKAQKEDLLNAGDYGEMLERAFKGNFFGSQLEPLKEAASQNLMQGLQTAGMQFSTLLGVPTRNSQKEDISFQGVDRLVNIMTSGGTGQQTFHMLIVWEPATTGEILQFESVACQYYNYCSKEPKIVFESFTQNNNESKEEKIDQESSAQSTGNSEQKNDTKSGDKRTIYTQENDDQISIRNVTKSITSNTKVKENISHSKIESKSDTTNTSKNHNTRYSTSNSVISNIRKTKEEQNKIVQDYMQYIAETLLPRIRHGKAKGLYKTAIYLGATNKLDLALLENALITICQGDKDTFTPLYARPLPHNEAASALVSSLNIQDNLEAGSRLFFLDSRPVLGDTLSLCTWLTAAEISMLAGMPQKEVPGLELRKQVSFGLNIESPGPDNRIDLGHIMQEGSHLKRHRVCLDRKELSKHIFIAGTTGSGKTTTCHKLLASSSASGKGLPFLVIEPAKTEYRALLRGPNFSDTIIFTVGNEKGVPFRFNPFEFLPEESLSGHVDMLKAAFMASFEMEAAIPNLLEEGIYRAYEETGWDFRDDNNHFLQDRGEAWNCDGRYFPTISSYIETVLRLVDQKGFDARLRGEYKGSIRGRLDSLTAGTKGLMLDTHLSVDFNELIDRKVILELEDLKSSEDKSFLMGLVLGRVTEVLKARHRKAPDFRHITLLEEAHRLLTRPQPGDSPNRKLGVETFVDLLAEVRKYGESLIIVDQIPGKLAPEVLKNTNTKIIHKIFARDDKDVVGDTMALDDDQKAYLSHMGPGEAVIFSQGWKKPVNVQVEILRFVTTNDEDLPQEKINKAGWEYWLHNPHRFCPGLPRDFCTFDTNPENLRRIVYSRDTFWEKLLHNAEDWEQALQQLRCLLKEHTDAFLTTLLATWVMEVPGRSDKERQEILYREIPEFVRLLNNHKPEERQTLADEIKTGSFNSAF